MEFFVRRRAALATFMAGAAFGVACNESAPAVAAVVVKALEVAYDNTTSGLGASNVQAAIDEVSANAADQGKAIAALDESTTAALDEQQAKVTDLESGLAAAKTDIEANASLLSGLSADGVSFDDSETAMGATTTQEAIAHLFLAQQALVSELAATKQQLAALETQTQAVETSVVANAAGLDELGDKLEVAMTSPRPCPDGMVAANSTFCVDVYASGPVSFKGASYDCSDHDRRLCTADEMLLACLASNTLDLKGGLGDKIHHEWVDDVTASQKVIGEQDIAVAAALGGIGCNGIIESHIETIQNKQEHPYRCCWSR